MALFCSNILILAKLKARLPNPNWLDIVYLLNILEFVWSDPLVPFWINLW